MNGVTHSRTWFAIAWLLIAVGGAGSAYGQLGYFGTPSDFSLPSQNFYVGGRYSGYDTGSQFGSPSSGGPSNLASPGAAYRAANLPPIGSRDAFGGTVGYGPGLNIPEMMPTSTIQQMGRSSATSSALPMSNPSFRSMGDPWTQPLSVQTPQYERPLTPQNYGFFEPTVTLDSMVEPIYHDPIGARPSPILQKGPSPDAFKIQNILTASVAARWAMPQGGLAGRSQAGGAAGPAPAPGAKEPASPAVLPARQAEIVGNFSQIKATQLNQDAAECLKQAMDAIKKMNYRSTGDTPGSIALFRRAQLLAGDRPEPVLGQIASLVAVGDYRQAAAMLGPLARRWPDTLTQQDLLSPYGQIDQMRLRLLAIRQSRIGEEPDLDLLVAFYRWFLESRQTASMEVLRLANAAGRPDSAAAAMAAAMQKAMAGGGS